MLWSGTTGPALDVKFKSAQNDVTFQCNLDKTSWQPCLSPKPLSGLSDAYHAFAIRAMDPYGNVSSPRVQNWKVDATGPSTTITSPAGATQVAFVASEKGTSQCSVDGGAFAACTSPYSV